MRRIVFEPSNLPPHLMAWWNQWQTTAQTATEAIIKQWECTKKLCSKDFDSTVWKALKDWLLDEFFHGKCAYCETKRDQARQSGDAEHYRPKAAVNFRSNPHNKLTTVFGADEQGQSVKHPGYFWLAYDWRNLLPACRQCNAEQGKKNQFPVQKHHVFLRTLTASERSRYPQAQPSKKWPNVFYLSANELSRLEDPLLLHPYFHDPNDHLRFGVRGIISAKSEIGRHSIQVYNLDTEGLNEARSTQQRDAYNKFQAAYNEYALDEEQSCTPETCIQVAREHPAVRKILEHKTPHSVAAIAFLCEHWPKMAQQNSYP
jgi:hypothetical protein